MRRDDLSDDFIPLSTPKIHGNLIRKGLKIQREGRGQPPLPIPKMSRRAGATLGPPERRGCSQGACTVGTIDSDPKIPTAEAGCSPTGEQSRGVGGPQGGITTPRQHRPFP